MSKLTEQEKKEKEELKSKQVKEIISMLLKSPNGLMATEIASNLGIKDTRLVRDLTRCAIREAEKQKLKVSRERIQGKATKIYNISSNGIQNSVPKSSK